MAWYHFGLKKTAQSDDEHLNEVHTEEFDSVLREASGAKIEDLTEEGFRPILTDANRNLTPLTQARMRKVSAKLWESNLLANRLIEIPLAYLLAEGISLTHDNEKYQDVLSSFWDHPINQFDIKLEKRLRELGLYGEIFMPAFVAQNGRVRIGYLDAENVKEIIFDPDNPEQPIGVITHRDKKGNYLKYQVIVNGSEDDCFTDRTMTIREQFTDGQLFYFSINSLGSHGRGRGDLLAQADYLDIYDHMLYGEADRVDFLRAFVWHFKIEGATDEDIKGKWKDLYGKPPAPSSTVVSNDKVTMEAKSPNINSGDTEQTARLFRNHILGGGTVPEQIFGGGGDVNRSTGETMMEPFEKVLKMRQKISINILKSVGVFVLRMHLMRGDTAKEPELNHEIYDLKVQAPEMTAKDTSKYAAALQQVISACLIAINGGLLTKETAVRIIDSIAGRLGVDIDAAEELKSAEEAKKEVKTKEDEDDLYTEADDKDKKVA
jgi:hypothetical protein